MSPRESSSFEANWSEIESFAPSLLKLKYKQTKKFVKFDSDEDGVGFGEQCLINQDKCVAKYSARLIMVVGHCLLMIFFLLLLSPPILIFSFSFIY